MSNASLSRHALVDQIVRVLSCGAGLISLLTLISIFIFLLVFSLPLLTSGHWSEIMSWTWRPYQGHYGILPMIVGSLALSTAAFMLAYPTALGICIFVCAPWANPWLRQCKRLVLAVITFMTAIPTIVYGFVSLFLLIPLLSTTVGGNGPSILAASLTLSLLILPTIVLFLHAALSETEQQTRLTSASLGCTPLQAVLLVVLPGSASGLRMAAIMGFCRAISDTLIPLTLAGNAPQIPASVFDSIRTLTAHIALVVATDNSSPAFHSLFACGLLLFGTTLIVQLGLYSRKTKNTSLGPRSLGILATMAAHPVWRSLVLGWSIFSVSIILGAIGALMSFLLYRSLPVINLHLFFGDAPVLAAIFGRAPVWDGIFAACVGTMALVVLASCMAIPLGISAGIALSHYIPSPIRQALSFSANALAGVPSIVMGLFGFSLIIFLRHTIAPEANTCLLLAALCIALLVLPYTINATVVALASMPEELRLLGPSLGMTTWQSLRHILLPAASRGILKGAVLSMGRAAEDTAVILLTGVVASGGLPKGLLDKFEALPFAIYYLATQYQSEADLHKGFAAALTLLTLTVLLYGCARALRTGMEKT